MFLLSVYFDMSLGGSIKEKLIDELNNLIYNLIYEPDYLITYEKHKRPGEFYIWKYLSGNTDIDIFIERNTPF